MSEMEGQESNQKHLCPECAAHQSQPQIEQLIYAIGTLDVRFPTIGIEREFHQRELALQLKQEPSPVRGKRIEAVLKENTHLCSRVCFILSVGSVPAYIVAPSSQSTLLHILQAVGHAGSQGAFVVLIGRRVGTAGPGQCGGLLAPIVACDQLYPFTLDEWLRELEARLEHVFKSGDKSHEHFGTVARELFTRVAQSTENIGALDTHRALNYVLVQHPGLALSAAERKGSVLDRVETRTVQGTDLRRIVAVILTFVDRRTGVAERLFCRVDVTEEWPFLIDGTEAGAPALGLSPYIENALSGAIF